MWRCRICEKRSSAAALRATLPQRKRSNSTLRTYPKKWLPRMLSTLRTYPKKWLPRMLSKPHCTRRAGASHTRCRSVRLVGQAMAGRLPPNPAFLYIPSAAPHPWLSNRMSHGDNDKSPRIQLQTVHIFHLLQKLKDQLPAAALANYARIMPYCRGPL